MTGSNDPSRQNSVDYWSHLLAGALEEAEAKRPELERNREKFLAKLNKQHGRIRSWDLGAAAPAAPNGWRLLK